MIEDVSTVFFYTAAFSLSGLLLPGDAPFGSRLLFARMGSVAIFDSYSEQQSSEPTE